MDYKLLVDDLQEERDAYKRWLFYPTEEEAVGESLAHATNFPLSVGDFLEVRVDPTKEWKGAQIIEMQGNWILIDFRSFMTYYTPLQLHLIRDKSKFRELPHGNFHTKKWMKKRLKMYS